MGGLKLMWMETALEIGGCVVKEKLLGMHMVLLLLSFHLTMMMAGHAGRN